MKILIILSLFVLTSCASVGGALVRGVIPDISIKTENHYHPVTENRTVNETRTVQEVNILMPKNVEPQTALTQVPQIGMKESKVYFYPAP